MKYDILNIIRLRTAESPITKDVLLEVLGLMSDDKKEYARNERMVRNIIHDLVFEDHEPILSTSSNPAGYFYAQSDDDYNQSISELTHRALNILQRRSILKRARQQRHALRPQMELAI